MSNFFGMPGPGGSLGQCAVCGKTFVSEVLQAKTVKSFTITGIGQTMFAHDKCAETLNNCGADWTKLPVGPLRDVFEQSNAEPAAAAASR